MPKNITTKVKRVLKCKIQKRDLKIHQILKLDCRNCDMRTSNMIAKIHVFGLPYNYLFLPNPILANISGHYSRCSQDSKLLDLKVWRLCSLGLI